MVVRRGKPAPKTTARKPAAKAATTARKPAARTPAKPVTTRKAAPAKVAPKKAKTDVTVYADKEPTGYHKTFAKWITTEVGYDPNDAASKRGAFLKGVSIACAARPVFMESDLLAAWRETSGEAKRGPKPKTATTSTRGTSKTRRVETPVEDDDEFDIEDEDTDDVDFEDEEELEDEDDEFEDESEEDDDEFDDEDEDEEDDDDFEDEEEEEAPPAKPARGKAAARKPAARTTTRKPAATRGRSKAAASEEDDLF